jgi:hypothetical protein
MRGFKQRKTDVSLFWQRNDGAIIHAATGLIVPQTEWARRGRRVARFFGKWLPDVFRMAGYLGIGAAIFFVAQTLGIFIGEDRGFIEGCTAAAGAAAPCRMVDHIKELRRQIPPIAEPNQKIKEARQKWADLQCAELAAFPAPVGPSLARYVDCSR